jgi:hypothetical protein
LPLLPLVQFPWRFLSVQAFAGAIVVSYLPLVWEKRERVQRVFVWGAIGLTVVFGLWHLHPEQLDIRESEVTRERLRLYEQFTGNIGSTVRYEYLPQWVEMRPYTSEAVIEGKAKGQPLILSGNAQTRALELGPIRERWQLSVDSSTATVAFQTYYFPGWKASLDDVPVAMVPAPGLGYIQVEVPEGDHQITLRFDRTPNRLAAEILSLIALGLGLLLSSREMRQSKETLRSWLLYVLVGIASLSALLYLANLVWTASQAPSDYTDLTMDFDRQPYLHHNRQGVNYGNRIQLVSYRMAPEHVKADEAVELTLRWNRPAPDLRAEIQLVSFAALRRAVAPPLAQHQTAITKTVSKHQFVVPPDTVPGLYLVSVQVSDGNHTLSPLNAQGETLGTTFLQPLRVENELILSEASSPLGHYGPCLDLLQVDAQQHGSALDASFYWASRCQPKRNYALSVRLKGADGRQLTALDIPPHYGYYPTSFWASGLGIPDRCRLLLPQGTPPGTDYALEVVVYEADSLQAIGSITVPGVHLDQFTISQDYETLQDLGPLRLISADLSPEALQEGEPITLDMTWAAASTPTMDYAYRLQFEAERGERWYTPLFSLVPGYPTTQWPAGALVDVRQSQRDLLPGTYRVKVELVRATGGETSDVVGAYTIAEGLVVKARSRSKALPDDVRRISVNLGGQVELLGYDMRQEDRQLYLTLYWRAMAEMDEEYKVFVHVLHPTEETIIAQADAMPQGNTYPTSQWTKDEVIPDEIILSLADVSTGAFRVAVGMYDPDTGSRLEASAEDAVTVSANRIILPERVNVQ